MSPRVQEHPSGEAGYRVLPTSGHRHGRDAGCNAGRDDVADRDRPHRRARLGSVDGVATMEAAAGLWVPRTVSRSLISAFAAARRDRQGPDQPSMITLCGHPTRVPDACSCADMAGAACLHRHRQGRRDPDAAARDRRTAPHQSSPEDVLARPRRAQRTEQTARECREPRHRLRAAPFPKTYLNITVRTRASMIARCGPRTRLPDARSRAGLAGAARPLRCRQGRRDAHAAPRGRRTAPHQPATSAHLARPRGAQRAEQAAACPATPAAAGLAPNPAALARPTRCPPLDLPAPTAGPTTYPAADPVPSAADGPRESPLGDTGASTAS